MQSQCSTVCSLVVSNRKCVSTCTGKAELLNSVTVACAVPAGKQPADRLLGSPGEGSAEGADDALWPGAARPPRPVEGAPAAMTAARFGEGKDLDRAVPFAIGNFPRK